MKILPALSLMPAMLAFGNTAAAGPFEVSMGDPLKLAGDGVPEGTESKNGDMKRNLAHARQIDQDLAAGRE